MRPFCDTTEGVFAEEVVDVELGADGGGAAADPSAAAGAGD